ncbi:transcription factor Jun [Nematostella vectensis]|nr:transcription factor Jun [Nematostella vectensis]
MGDHHLYGNYDNMEVLFYEQNSHMVGHHNKYDKNSMRLNLRPPGMTGQENFRPSASRNLFSNSPDLGTFKIVTPDLEKFIGNNTGLTPKGNPIQLPSPEFPLFSLVSPEFDRILQSIQNKTPTPTRVLKEGNTVARQREVYVQGFAEALQHIHDTQNNSSSEQSVAVKVNHESAPSQDTYSIHSYQHAPQESTCDLESMHYSGSIGTVSMHQDLHQEMAEHSSSSFSDHMTSEVTFKYEEQAAPPHNSGLGGLPLPPIDLELQEIVKRERKKQKNRVAASKCRRKKLEREAQLEVRVQQLKEKSIELNAVASALRQQVGELKQRVLEHVAFGCQLPAVTNSAY